MESVWRIFHLVLQCFLNSCVDCTQSVRDLSNLELEKFATIFILFSVYLCSLFKAIRGLVLFFPN